MEGTRSQDGRMLPFKKGPFYLAMADWCALHTRLDLGNGDDDGEGQRAHQPGTAHIIFHAPVLPGDYETREELMAAVRAAIASGLPEWMRK